jgi:hypothetical protein
VALPPEELTDCCACAKPTHSSPAANNAKGLDLMPFGRVVFFVIFLF